MAVSQMQSRRGQGLGLYKFPTVQPSCSNLSQHFWVGVTTLPRFIYLKSLAMYFLSLDYKYVSHDVGMVCIL